MFSCEIPHRHKYFRATIDGRDFPGEVRGMCFAYSPCSNYAAFQWQREIMTKETVAVDLRERRFFVLPQFIHTFSVH